MPKVTFRQHDGVAKTLEVRTGTTLMEAALFNGIDGMYAACGGDGGCATCHVYVDEAWISRLAAKSRKENNTLRFALDPTAASRLACQITVQPELDGLIISLPERQF